MGAPDFPKEQDGINGLIPSEEEDIAVRGGFDPIVPPLDGRAELMSVKNDGRRFGHRPGDEAQARGQEDEGCAGGRRTEPAPALNDPRSLHEVIPVRFIIPRRP